MNSKIKRRIEEKKFEMEINKRLNLSYSKINESGIKHFTSISNENIKICLIEEKGMYKLVRRCVKVKDDTREYGIQYIYEGTCLMIPVLGDTDIRFVAIPDVTFEVKIPVGNLNQTTELINILNQESEVPSFEELNNHGIDLGNIFANKIMEILSKGNGRSRRRKNQGKS
jgi:hypothetical protein